MAEINIMESLLADGEDNALVRFTMGSAFIKHEKYEQAAEQLAIAVALQPTYAAAWLRYAEALVGAGKTREAISALEKGISVTNEKANGESRQKLGMMLNELQS